MNFCHFSILSKRYLLFCFRMKKSAMNLAKQTNGVLMYLGVPSILAYLVQLVLMGMLQSIPYWVVTTKNQ